jgi:hypothetical protein
MNDVVQLVRGFFQIGIMPAHINETHIARIPKKLVHLVPANYRPISLCNVIYRIIAKCLANRLNCLSLICRIMCIPRNKFA